VFLKEDVKKMSKITGLNVGKRRKQRVNLFLDGKFAFSLETELVVKEGLKVEQELADSQLEELRRSDQLQCCLNAANRLLGYRPRSESELRVRLQRRSFDSESIEAALSRMKKYGLLDDTAFAQFWQENRTTFSPRSSWLTGQELKRKGVSNEIISQVAETIDDSDNAYRAALSRVRRLPMTDYQVFRRRLGDFLRRRGFGYEVISHVIEQVWREYGSSSG